MASTDHLTVAQTIELFSASEFLIQHHHCCLNRHVTICWKHCGITNHQEAFDAFQKYRELLRKWLAYHGCEVFYLWTMENSRTNGIHSHLAVFCPDNLADEFKIICRQWVPVLHPNAVFVTDKFKNSSSTNSQAGLCRYITKTIDQTATVMDRETGEIVRLAELVGIEPRKANDNDAGPITVKRAGTSQNLGKAARHRASFRSSFDQWQAA